MDNQKTEELIKLTPEEEQRLRDGQSLYEMSQSAGFKVLSKWLEDMAYHSWVDPRDVDDKKEWEWRELNAFHAANNAREILESINKAINDADFLQKKKRGEIKNQRMRF